MTAMSIAHFAGSAPGDAPSGHPRGVADVEIVIPVYNEAEQLAASITALRTYLDRSFPLVTTVTIADNASTDDTWRIASQLAGDLPGVSAIHLDQKGRGRALRAVWTSSHRRRRGLHGRRPGHRPRCAAPAGGPSPLGPQRPGHRHPSGPWGPRGPGRTARVHLPRLQPAAAIHAPQHVQRRPVRLQGHAPGGGRRAAPPGRGRGVVLRHRSAGDRPTAGAPHPRGPGGLGGRHRLPRRGPAHRVGRSPRGMADAGPGVEGPGTTPPGPAGDGRHRTSLGHRAAPGARRSARGTTRTTNRRFTTGVGGLRRRTPPLRRGRGGQYRGLRRPLRGPVPRTGQLHGQHRGHRGVQPGQHRRPPGHGSDRRSRAGPGAPRSGWPPGWWA